jgi:hypothetical protein
MYLPPNQRERLEEMWQGSKRNRLLMLIGTGAVVLALFCGCLGLVGTMIGNSLTSLASSSNPGARPTLPPSGTQVAQTNPTFPVPQPTMYNTPPSGATPVGSSGTPAPTATASPTPSVTDTPTPTPTDPGGGGGGGNSPVTFQISPDPSGMAFVAGQTNQITLSGPPGMVVSLSIYTPGSSACVSMNKTLDGTGQAVFTCNIAANLQNTTVPMSIQTFNPGSYNNYTVPVH